MTLPFALSVYRAATRALAPFAKGWLASRARSGKEDPERLGERFGQTSAARPNGPLVWLHGASVGESLMLLAVLEAIRRERPDLRFLVTTGTVTSAELMAQRLPDSAVHQYAPLDTPAAVRTFVAHWRPDLGVLAESELWPNLILEAKASGAKLALINARLNAASLARWRTWSPASARHLLSQFDWIGAADAETAEGLSALAGHPIALTGNLKRASDPPTADPDALAALKAAIGARRVWLAASTHPGEEPIALEAHRLLREAEPDALLIVAPRHPDRGASVAQLAREESFSVRRRSAGEPPDAEVAVYVADTLGEMGLWLRLADAALIGGSLVPGVGGHNPLEPAALSTPILTGPHTASFAAIYNELEAAGGAARVRTAAEIFEEIRLLEGDRRLRRIAAALAAASGGAAVLGKVMAGLLPLAPDRGHG
jgi:3-deoxy-D-manno-octulosonic-acid transferase